MSPRDEEKVNGDVSNGHTSESTTSQQDGAVPPVSDGSVLGDEDPAERMTLGPFNNGYHFPPSHSFADSFKRGSISFAKYCVTPVGFLVVLYGLNVVAWGGMIFLLLLNAAPAMCTPDCNDINSPRRIWIEYDSQILNALFCVTGFGLAPWRLRDLYYLLAYRVRGRQLALRRLAGIHRGWFRLPDSDKLPVEMAPENVEQLASGQPAERIPFPEKRISDPPLTGVRAAPTKWWKMDFVVWSNIWNTFFQCGLSGFMWGMNRYDRPAAPVGIFVAAGMWSATQGGLMMFFEGKRVKSIEGVPLTEEDLQRLERDKELGVVHYNNIKDKKPKVKKPKKKRASKA